MNKVLSLVRAARTAPDPDRGMDSEQMLSELLALNEEMIAQLRLECLGGAETADFIREMIGQHEKAAAMLRAQLENHGADFA